MHSHGHAHDNPAQTEGRLIRWANSYDLLVNLFTLGQVYRLREMTVELAGLQPGDSLLDVGCGPGSVTIPAKKRLGTNGRAAGIDPSPEMIARARQNAAQKGLDIDFRVGVIEDLPFPDATFDVVTASLMIHHLPGDLKASGLAEVYRVLKPGGRLLIADFMRPTESLSSRIFTAVSMHLGMAEGIEDLPQLLERARFSQINRMKERFLVIGFVKAIK
jgi:demethylmenaquinone methyltransferase/2-methoxy-6-polyprenyl-1,4-benzoquinol methylase/phosphoethanolamine N-methyltransferase